MKSSVTASNTPVPPIPQPVQPRRAGASVLRGAYDRLASSTALVTIMMMTAVPAAHASGSSMPWEAPLQKILESVEGPVAKIVAVIIIIVTGLTLAFGDTAGGFRRLIQIVFGLSIAFAASSFFLSFFSFGGGALI
ncbi:P-type conjugative transfer ATPase TrbB [Polymorphum gilvum SL003B-26A1]|jgi:type IV secretion system protein VirB2|uniref:P-type conjugative transfer ATPase TrbB n=1 Tax=Polymorphum gilvum (strain LMG 25793 / CGMCC 1.9160 / SL003B-26A1) TaxID=991905 RepID=F2J175_POLGS|nr:P-type conjugative transfer ATPase TrbB [Polymorphum gilvum SL003B-26A1]